MKNLDHLVRYREVFYVPESIRSRWLADARKRNIPERTVPTEIVFYLVEGLKIMPTNNPAVGWDHISISPQRAESLTPTWEQMCRMRDLFFNDDEVVLQYHPPLQNHVNCATNTLHLWRCQNAEIPLPPCYRPNATAIPSTERLPGIRDLSHLSECRHGSGGDEYNGMFRIDRNGRDLYVVTSTKHNGWDCVTVYCQQGTPRWEEMHHVRRMFLEEAANGVQIHPPKSMERTFPPNSLEIWVSHYQRIPSPDPALVGGLRR